MSKEKKKGLVPRVRFPEFREAGAWELQKLGDLTYKTDRKNKAGEKLPVYSINNQEGFLPQSDQFEGVDSNNRGYDTTLYKVIEKNTFAYNPARIDVGSIGYSGELHNIIISSLYVCFKTKESLEDVFLLQFLKTTYFNQSVRDKVEGGIRNYLFYENFSTIKIYLPKGTEQQKIAATLTSLDDLITAQSEKIKALQAHKKGLMQQLFPAEGERVPRRRFGEFEGAGEWEERTLGGYLELLTDFEANGSFADTKANVTIYDTPNYAWYVRATDLENEADMKNVKYVDHRSYRFLRKTSLIGGELLISKRGEIGKVYYFTSRENLLATVAPNLYLLKMNKEAVPKFFYYFFINSFGNQLLKRLNASSTIGALYKDDVKKIIIVAPYFNEQQKIAALLTSLDNLITAHTQKLEALKAHKKGLMQQLFPDPNEIEA